MYLSTTGLWFTLITLAFAQLPAADASHQDITRAHSRRSFDIRNKQSRRLAGSYERRLLGLDVDTPLGDINTDNLNIPGIFDPLDPTTTVLSPTSTEIPAETPTDTGATPTDTATSATDTATESASASVTDSATASSGTPTDPVTTDPATSDTASSSATTPTDTPASPTSDSQVATSAPTSSATDASATTSTQATTTDNCLLGLDFLCLPTNGPTTSTSATPTDSPSQTPTDVSITPSTVPTDGTTSSASIPTEQPTTAVSTPATDPPVTTSAQATTTDSGCLLGLDLLCIPTGNPTTSATPTDTPSQAPTDATTSQSAAPTTVATTSPTEQPTTAVSTPATDAPGTTSAQPTTTDSGCLLGLDLLCIPTGNPTTSASATPTTTPISNPPTDSATPTDNTSISNPLTGIIPTITSILSPILPTSTPVTSIDTTGITSGIPTSVDITSGIPISISTTVDVTSGLPTSAVTTVSTGVTSDPSGVTSAPSGVTSGASSSDSVVTSSGATGVTSGVTSGATSGASTISGVSSGASSASVSGSSTAIISFPTTLPSSAQTSFSSLSTVSTALPDSVSSDPPINSQFTFLSTATSLLLAPTQSSSSLSLSDPDAPTSTISLATTLPPTASPSVAALPSGLPARIYPASGVDPTTDDLDGFQFITLLFDQLLPWPWVCGHTETASQIFAYTPVVIQKALSVNSDQVKSFALQVWKPQDYTGPTDQNKLLTMWMGYIPKDMVDDLAQQLLVRNSGFYTAAGQPYVAIAEHVNAAFPINSVTAPTDDGSAGTGTSGSANTGASSSSKTRENVIIGVVSSLGGITLLVLAFLVVRAVKQRRELAHRRLSDVPAGVDAMGSRPDGQDFDRDSVGGQRRRSFYYAEDSLRGFADTQPGGMEQYDQRVTENGMRERRPVNAGMISTPILRDNTMNW